VIDTATVALELGHKYSMSMFNTYANPDQANAPRPTAIVMNTTDHVGSIMYAVSIMKTVWAKTPEQKAMEAEQKQQLQLTQRAGFVNTAADLKD